jgi:VanZ family protein
MTRGLLRWRLAAAIWAAAIFVSGVVPTQSMVTAVSGGHDTAVTTAAHFAVYAVLGFMLGVALSGWIVDARGVLVALVLAAVLGGAIEVIQGRLSYRDAQLADFLVDVAGAAVGLAVFSAVARGRRSRSHPG